MTITTGNALPIATISADVSTDAQSSDPVQMLLDGTSLVDATSLPPGFQSLLDQQMNMQDAAISPNPAAAEATPEAAMQSILGMSRNSEQGSSNKATATLSASTDTAQAEADRVSLENAGTIDNWSPAMPVVANMAETVPGKTANDAQQDSKVDDGKDIVVVPIAVAIDTPEQGFRRATGGESLPLVRQTVALPSVILAAHKQTMQPRDEALAHTGRTASPVKDDTPSFTLTGEQGGGDSEQNFKQADGLKFSLDTPHHESLKLASLTADQATAQAQPPASAGDASDAWQIKGEFNIHAAQQPSATVSANPVQPTLHSLHLPAQASPLQWGDALSEKVSMLINHKRDRAEIRIDPPHLGKLDIQIHLKADSATIQIHTHHAATRDLIDAASFRLKDFLHNSGYSAVDVNVSHRDQSMGQGAHGGQQQAADVSEISEPSSALLPETHAATRRIHACLSVQGVVDYFA